MSIAVSTCAIPSPKARHRSGSRNAGPFSDAQMSEALALCQQLRKDERHAHVVISSELRDMVGPVGVSAVEDGKTPDGVDYQWSKAGRAGASRRNAAEPPRPRQDMDC